MIYKEKVPQKSSKIWIFWIFWFSAGTFTAPTGGTVGVPRCHSLRLYMRYDKKMKSKKFPKTIIFFDEFFSSKDFEKSNISKNHLFRKKLTFWKNRKCLTFPKKVDFLENVEFFKKHRKSLLKFFNFQKLLKKYLSSKKYTFSEIFHVVFFCRI